MRRTLSWPLLTLNAGVVVGAILWLATVLPTLPDRVPVHWGPSGPNRWSTPNELWLFAAMMIFDTLVMLVALFSVGRPTHDLTSLPRSERLRAERAVDELRVAESRLVQWMFVGFNVCVAGISVVAVEAARTMDVRLVNTGVLVMLVGVIVVIAVPLVVFLPKAVRARRVLSELDVSDGTKESDWVRGGLFYHAKDDARLWVPKRYGVGWTLNFAHGESWAILIALVGLPIAVALVTSIVASR